MLNINLSYILSPLSQFEVNSLIGLELPILGNFYISITNLTLYSILILIHYSLAPIFLII